MHTYELKDEFTFEYLADRFGTAAALMLTSKETHTKGDSGSLRDLNTYKRIKYTSKDGVIVIG